MEQAEEVQPVEQEMGECEGCGTIAVLRADAGDNLLCEECLKLK